MTTSSPGPLLFTKMNPPPLRRAVLPRTRLLAHLNDSLERPVTLIAASAGFGKSTLIGQWLQMLQGQTRVAWLSLDPGDNDPARFWGYVLATFEQVIPDMGGEIRGLLHGPQAGAIEAAIALLLNRLQLDEQPLVLVLDDYHVITQAEIHRSLAYAIDHLPAHARVVICTRTDPPLPLNRWRARDQLVEVRAEQLRFTREEAHAFLTELMGLPLGPVQTAALETRTEGWAAGLHLAGLSLRGQRSPEEFIAQFAVSHRTALDFLIEEVFAHQPAHIQRFLLQTAVLDRMTPALCDALLDVAQPLGDPWSRLLIDDLEQQNLFLIPLDAERTWYRYHHLFGAALRQRLQRTAPEQVAELHRRAAQWLRGAELPAEAVDHALAAGEAGLAADLIEVAAMSAWLRGETATLQRWIDALPTDVYEQRPTLLLWQGWIRLMHTDWERLAHAVDKAEVALEGQRAPESVHWGELLALKGWLARIWGDAAASYRLTTQALTLLRQHNSYWLAFVGNNAAEAAWDLGDRQAAQAHGEAAVVASERIGDYSLSSFSRGVLGAILSSEGRLSQAAALCHTALEMAMARGFATLPMNAYSQFVLAEVALLRDELDEAQQRAELALGLLPADIMKDAALRTQQILLGVARAQGDAGALDARLTRLEGETARTTAAAMDLRLRAQRAWLLLLDGEHVGAAQLLEGIDLTAPMAARTRGLARLTLALLRVRQQRAEEALGLLGEGVSVASALGTPVELLVAPVKAVALESLGRRDTAEHVLTDALTTAAPEGLVRPFLDLGRPLTPILRRLHHTLPGTHPAAILADELLARLERVVASDHGLQRAAPTAKGQQRIVQSLAEPLSQRELEVLALLAQGATNQQIADQLIITERTAKKHVTNILGKLEATNRTHAVALARSAGLLR